MRRYIINILIMIILLYSIPTLNVDAANKPDDNELYSISAALIDGDTGRILYEKNGFDIRAMASTTKIMTLILALEYGNLEDMVTVSDYASRMPDVQLNIKAGEQYRLEDLLYSLILESHNDTAVAVAEHIGGDVEGFANMMNKKAREIGLSNTYFITPNGLDASDENGTHSTTAVELALLMKYCVVESPAKEDFVRICQTRSHSFSDYTGKRVFSVNNKNSFLDMMEGVIAGKTGFTGDAGYCYVAALERNGKTYVIALLGCGWPNNKNYKWSDSKKLFNYGIDNYEYSIVMDETYELSPIPVINGVSNDYLDVYIKDEIGLILCEDDIVTYKVSLPDKVYAPIEEGDIQGNIYIYVNEELYTSINIYSGEKILEKDFWYCLRFSLFSFIK
ncbi:MAG: D-alanyl-D-alanine carboxypeptidase [Lachnospiraceae bacterium]|nr:D-alanyl-D-alanine carboxypeptidase [Lachnospiraceae bacterium]